MIAAFIGHLWQSAVFAGIAWLVTLSLRSHGAAIRHGVWLVASLKFLVPFALLTMLGSELRTLLTPAATPQLLIEFGHQALRPFQLPSFAASTAQATSSYLPIALVCVWAMGALVIAWRRAHEWWAGRQMLRATSKLKGYGALDIRSAPHLHEPAVIGVVRPTVLLPEGVASVLESSELKAVLAHEAAHIERRDNFTASLHMLVEILFWFHPLVWWMGAALPREAARVCDEAVLATGFDAQAYANGLRAAAAVHQPPDADWLARVAQMPERAAPAALGFAGAIAVSLGAWVVCFQALLAGAVHDRQHRHAVMLADARTLSASTIEMKIVAPGLGDRSQIVAGPHGVSFRNVNLRELLAYAYGVTRFDIWAPDLLSMDGGIDETHWLYTPRYDAHIAAELREPAIFDGYALQELVASTLEMRLGLYAHLSDDCSDACVSVESLGAVSADTR